MTSVFERLRSSIEGFGEALRARDHEQEISERILRERTDRIAREPVRVEGAADSSSCLLFERCGRRYAVSLDILQEVAPMGPVASVPGIPEIYLGVTARKGKVIAVLDLPQVFTPGVTPEGRPRWLVMAHHEGIMCALAADVLHDLLEVSPPSLSGAMPTFPSLAQRYTVGVLEDSSVVLDLGGLLTDRALQVEDRG